MTNNIDEKSNKMTEVGIRLALSANGQKGDVAYPDEESHDYSDCKSKEKPSPYSNDTRCYEWIGG